MKKLLILLLLIALPAISQAANITLSWDANTEPDLAGYKIHYNIGNPGPPFETIIDVGNVTIYILEGADPNKVYYLAATAYDTSGLESDYSNQVDSVKPGRPKRLKLKWYEVIGKTIRRLFEKNG